MSNNYSLLGDNSDDSIEYDIYDLSKIFIKKQMDYNNDEEIYKEALLHCEEDPIEVANATRRTNTLKILDDLSVLKKGEDPDKLLNPHKINSQGIEKSRKKFRRNLSEISKKMAGVVIEMIETSNK